MARALYLPCVNTFTYAVTQSVGSLKVSRSLNSTILWLSVNGGSHMENIITAFYSHTNLYHFSFTSKILKLNGYDSVRSFSFLHPTQLYESSFLIYRLLTMTKKHEFHHSRQKLSHGYAVQNVVHWRIWIVTTCIPSLLLTFIITLSKLNQFDITAELSQFVIKQGSFYWYWQYQQT